MYVHVCWFGTDLLEGQRIFCGKALSAMHILWVHDFNFYMNTNDENQGEKL